MFLPFFKCDGAFVHRFFHSPYAGFAHHLGPTETTSAVASKVLSQIRKAAWQGRPLNFENESTLAERSRR